jgi:AraC family transcriptional regulator
MTLRLDDAERCLKETDMSFYSIAQRLKFSSQSHLTSALRKYRQRTPGEIRSKRRH